MTPLEQATLREHEIRIKNIDHRFKLISILIKSSCVCVCVGLISGKATEVNIDAMAKLVSNKGFSEVMAFLFGGVSWAGGSAVIKRNRKQRQTDSAANEVPSPSNPPLS